MYLCDFFPYQFIGLYQTTSQAANSFGLTETDCVKNVRIRGHSVPLFTERYCHIFIPPGNFRKAKVF